MKIAVNVLGNNTYNVTGTDAYGCQSKGSVTVVVNEVPQVTATTNKEMVCNGFQVLLTGAGADTYAWSDSVTNGKSFVPSASKSYVVTGSNEFGCSATDTVKVVVVGDLSVEATSTALTICQGDNYRVVFDLPKKLTLSQLKSDGGPYSYSLSNLAESKVLYNPGVSGDISIAPVPFSWSLTIELPVAATSIELINAEGIVCYTASLHGDAQCTIATGDFYSGVYTVRVITPQCLYIKQVVKVTNDK